MFTVVHFRGVGGVNWVKYGIMYPKSDYISTFRLKLGWNIRWCTLHVYIFERESNGKRQVATVFCVASTHLTRLDLGAHAHV